jgi:hypothetical protein
MYVNSIGSDAGSGEGEGDWPFEKEGESCPSVMEW